MQRLQMECASAEISVQSELKSIGRFRPFSLPDPLLDALEINLASRIEDVPFIAMVDFDFVFVRPISEVRGIGAVAKFGTETATPFHEVLRLQIALRRRRIE